MATLKSLVDETSNIKDELKTCHTNLKNNLSSKGVSVSSEDKINNLINKISEINTAPIVVAGNSVTLLSTPKRSTYLQLNSGVLFSFMPTISGSIRFSFNFWCSGYSGVCEIIQKRGTTTIKTTSIKIPQTTSNSLSTITTADISDIKPKDIIEVAIQTSGSTNLYTYYAVTCNYA